MPSSERTFLAGLGSLLEEKIRKYRGLAGIRIIDLKTGSAIGVNDDLNFTVASSIKVALLVSLYRQARRGLLDVRSPFMVDQRHLVGGSGVLQYLDHPANLALEDLATLMINLSDNVATNILIDLVGMNQVNSDLDELGLSSMRLRRRMIDDLAAARGDENVSTMGTAAELMRLLWAGQIVDRRLCDDVLAILRKPKRQSPVAVRLPLDVSIANKPGGLEGVSCEFALVELARRPYVFCCAVNYSAEPVPSDLVAELSYDVYSWFSVLDRSTAYGRRLAMGALLAQERQGLT